ncbi:MAG: carboxypeptidase regulatory-like domain-containing protein [Acidobacteria bacterium]|nr:carboxypeptidase regulatory-like domain-containing protein [Acidobacteriota bacterium]
MYRLVLLLALSLPLLSQTTGLGRITGTVTDSTGLVVPEATVTVTNTDTAETRQAATNASGVYYSRPCPSAITPSKSARRDSRPSPGAIFAST